VVLRKSRSTREKKKKKKKREEEEEQWKRQKLSAAMGLVVSLNLGSGGAQ